MKNLVKAMSKANSSGIQYLAERFPKMNPAKMKEGIFIGLQIKTVLLGRRSSGSKAFWALPSHLHKRKEFSICLIPTRNWVVECH